MCMTLVDSSNEEIYLPNKAFPLHKVHRIALIKMFEYFFIDNIFAMFGERAFRQTVGIPMITNCVPLLAELFFY